LLLNLVFLGKISFQLTRIFAIFNRSEYLYWTRPT